MCPDCREPLLVVELEGVEIDRCLGCGGTWLDAGELDLIAALGDTEPGEVSAALEQADRGRRGSRRCPRCERRMNLVGVGEARPVELDACPLGHGFWLDRGELHAVLTNFSSGEAGAVSGFLGKLFQDKLQHESRGG